MRICSALLSFTATWTYSHYFCWQIYLWYLPLYFDLQINWSPFLNYMFPQKKHCQNATPPPPHGLDCRSEHKRSSNTLSLVLIWNLKNVQFLKCICAHFRLDGKQEVITLIVLKPSRYPQVSKDVQCIGLFTVVVRCLHTFIMGLNVYATDILL